MPRRSAYREGQEEVGARNLSPEGRAFTDRRPMLSLRVWCQLSGVAVVANLDRLDERGQLVRVEIANTEFRPPKVTERLIVEWAERCLRAWLEDQLDPKGPPGAWRDSKTPARTVTVTSGDPCDTTEHASPPAAPKTVGERSEPSKPPVAKRRGKG
jgi:hypothetical protein